MFAKLIEVLILRTDKLFSQKLSRVLPGCAFLGEDTLAQERSEDYWTNTEPIIFASVSKELVVVYSLKIY